MLGVGGSPVKGAPIYPMTRREAGRERERYIYIYRMYIYTHRLLINVYMYIYIHIYVSYSHVMDIRVVSRMDLGSIS